MTGGWLYLREVDNAVDRWEDESVMSTDAKKEIASPLLKGGVAGYL